MSDLKSSVSPLTREKEYLALLHLSVKIFSNQKFTIPTWKEKFASFVSAIKRIFETKFTSELNCRTAELNCRTTELNCRN
jgi:hypothetical protein